MKTTYTGLIGVVAIALALPGCSDKQEGTTVQTPALPQFAADGTWDEVEKYPVERSAEFRADLSERLTDLERQMEPLAAKAGQEWEAIRTSLAEKRDALAAQLEDLSAATAETWEQARDETISLYLNLRDAIARAASEPGE